MPEELQGEPERHTEIEFSFNAISIEIALNSRFSFNQGDFLLRQRWIPDLNLCSSRLQARKLKFF
jgi:hypothetical protein